jgi:hypothetical protein
MPLFALMALAGPVLAATDHVERELRTQACSLAVAAVAFVISAHFSLTAVAWAVVFVYAFRYWVTTVPTLRLLGIGWSDVTRVLVGPSLTAVITVCVVSAMNWVVSSHNFRPLYSAAGIGFTGAVTLFVLLALAGDRILPPELVTPLTHVITKLPKRLAWALNRLAARQKFRQEQQVLQARNRSIATAAFK